MMHMQRSMTTRFATAAGLSVALTLGAAAAPGFGSIVHSHATGRSQVAATKVSSVRGIVVARDLLRHSLVVSSSVGLVRTVRLASERATRRVRVGSEVASRVVALGDGTFHARSLKTVGRASRAKVRGTVVRETARGILLSAGGSVFVVRDHAKSGASARHVRSHISPTGAALVPGDVVEATVSYGASGAQESTGQLSAIQQLGQTGVIGLDGVLSSINSTPGTATGTSGASATSITIAVDQGALTTVAIPPSISLPSTIVAGDRIEVIAAYANQAFTLITIRDDSLAASATGQGASQGASSDTNPSASQGSNPGAGQASNTGGGVQNQAIDAEGYVVTATATTLVLQPGDGASTISFAIPSTLTTPTLTPGAQVHATGVLVAGTLTLTSVTVQQPQGDQGNSTSLGSTEVTGTVSTLTTTTLTVQPAGSGAPVTFAIPTGMSLTNIVLGGAVDATGALVSGVLTLTTAKVPDSATGDQGNSTSLGSTEVTGTVSTLTTTTLTVQPAGSGAPVTFAIPTGMSLTNVVLGGAVDATGALVSGVLTLSKAEVPDRSRVSVSGTITSLSTTSLVVLSSDSGLSTTFTVPANFNFGTIGQSAKVTAKGTLVGLVPTLTSIALND